MSSVSTVPNIGTSGSGIDVTAVVDQILNAERAPVRLLETQKSSLAVQSTTLSSINVSLLDLKTKVDALKDFSGPLTSKSATSSNSAVLTATAQSSAVPGNHEIVVDSLATTSSYYTDPLDPEATLSPGSFDLQVGSGPVVTVTISSANGNDTLNSLAEYINDAGLGVSASVVSDASGSRLALVSNTTGTPGDLTISSNTSPELVFTKGATGTNASLTVDGVPVSVSGNTVTGVLAGVTLNLTGASPGNPVQLTVAADKAAATKAINDFVNSYNTVIKAVNAQFTFNTASNTAGPLAGDSFLRSLQTSLLNDITYSISGNNDFVSLATLGVDMNDNGTLSVDSTQLDSVLTSNFSDVQNFFQASSTPNGFALNFGSDLLNLTSTTGIVSLDLKQMQDAQTAITDQINDFEDRLAVREKFLINQYSRVDAMLRQFPLIMQQLTSQLGTLAGLQSS